MSVGSEASTGNIPNLLRLFGIGPSPAAAEQLFLPKILTEHVCIHIVVLTNLNYLSIFFFLPMFDDFIKRSYI